MNTEQQRTFEQIKEYILGAEDIIPYIEDINIPEAKQLLYVRDEKDGERYISRLFFSGFFSLREIKFLLKSNKRLFTTDNYINAKTKYEAYLNRRLRGAK